MYLLPTESNLEGTALGCDSGGVVPLHVICLPVMKIDRLPVWIVARVERPTILIELVGEDELPVLARLQVNVGLCVVRRVDVNETPVSGNRRHLARGVDSSKVESTVGRDRLLGEICDQRISGAAQHMVQGDYCENTDTGYLQQGNDPSAQDRQAAEVSKTSGCEYVTTFIAPMVSSRIRIVEVVVVFRLVHHQVGAPSRGIRREGILQKQLSRRVVVLSEETHLVGKRKRHGSPL